VLGAALGTLVKGLTHEPQTGTSGVTALGTLQALAVSVMATIAVVVVVVVVAFARKSSAQPLVSVEDFWGGMVIGFTVGYFGFNQFLHLFPAGSGG